MVERHYIDLLLPDDAVLEFVEPHCSYSVQEFVLPGFLSRRFSGYLPQPYLDWFLPQVLPTRQRRANRRILISRQRTARGQIRCILNEDELFTALEPHGFERIVLEDLAPAQQIELFFDAAMVVGAHGAGLANLLFAQGAKVVELFPQKWVVPHYYFLSKGLGHEYTYCLGNEKSRKSNFRVDVQAVTKIVSDLAR